MTDDLVYAQTHCKHKHSHRNTRCKNLSDNLRGVNLLVIAANDQLCTDLITSNCSLLSDKQTSIKSNLIQTNPNCFDQILHEWRSWEKNSTVVSGRSDKDGMINQHQPPLPHLSHPPNLQGICSVTYPLPSKDASSTKPGMMSIDVH